MKVIREYDINKIIEFEATDKDRFEIVKQILNDQLTTEKSNLLLSEILCDELAAELEFDQRPYVITAFETLIKALK